MFKLIKECAGEFVNHFDEMNEDVVVINSKEAFRKYANDVIATAAFGIKCNSFKDPNNDFFLMGAEAINFKGFRVLKFMIGPKLKKVTFCIEI